VEALQVEREEGAGTNGQKTIMSCGAVPFATRNEPEERDGDCPAKEGDDGGCST
jgi:hypothetical protein